MWLLKIICIVYLVGIIYSLIFLGVTFMQNRKELCNDAKSSGIKHPVFVGVVTYFLVSFFWPVFLVMACCK